MSNNKEKSEAEEPLEGINNGGDQPVESVNNESEEGVAEVEGVMDVSEQLQQERDKYLRLYSEFENFRRRTTKDRLDWMQTASKDVLVSMLPVVDDFERALKAMENLMLKFTRRLRSFLHPRKI
jgi:molecular chaperone GrpE